MQGRSQQLIFRETGVTPIYMVYTCVCMRSRINKQTKKFQEEGKFQERGFGVQPQSLPLLKAPPGLLLASPTPLLPMLMLRSILMDLHVHQTFP